MMWAKQSTAATLIVGPILDSAGAEYASAVIGDLSISKNGGTLTAMASAATLTYIANGQYTLVTTTGNLDTLGRAQITCNKSTYQMPPVNLMILPAMRFDSLVLGTDDFDVNATKWNDLTTVALPLIPTTAGRTLDVSATGEAGVDWANVGSPTTSLALTGTTIAITQKVDLETIKTNPVVNAGTVTFPTTATLASTTNITAGTITTVTTTTTATNLTNLPTIPANWLTAAGLATDAVAEIQSGLSTLDAAGVRTAVGLASANLDTQLGTLATATNLATVAGYLDTEIAAILQDTNELQTDWANGGRLDLILDIIAADTTTDIPALIATVDTWVKRNAVILSGLISTAGTATEVFTISAIGVTATVTVDASGNRSNVVWS